MDADKFGQFLVTRRKEKNMTQADLARKLSVTDKAISKWERGLGFPDIHTLEPLAEALEISLYELMRSEKNEDGSVSREEASTAVEDAFSMAETQCREERKALLRVSVGVMLLIAVCLWVDCVGLEIFLMVYFPIICLFGGVGVLAYGLWRLIRHQSCWQTFLLAGLLMLVPLVFVLFLLYGYIHGLGPVPS